MTEKEIKKSLKYIKKHGDLFEAIISKGTNSMPLLKVETLAFSRILFVLYLSYLKIKSFFIPIEKIKSAQDKLRHVLHIPVDFIEYPNTSTLSILYENETNSKEQYIKNLKKILTFCTHYKIRKVILFEKDLQNIYIEKSKIDFLNEYFRAYFTNKDNNELETNIIRNKLNEVVCKLSLSELTEAIQLLEVSSKKEEKEIIPFYAQSIKDIFVKRAIENYKQDFDLKKLEKTLKDRLSCLLNNDSLIKDKDYGKIEQSFSITNDCLFIKKYDLNGNFIDQEKCTLSQYFNVKNSEELLAASQTKIGEEKDLVLLVSFYLNLNHQNKQKQKKASISFMDSCFKIYQLKKTGKIKKMPINSYQKYATFQKNTTTYTFLWVYMFCILKVASKIDPNNEDYYSNVENFIIESHEKSWEFEKELFITPIIENLQEMNLLNKPKKEHSSDYFGDILASTGDTDYQKNIEIATITPLTEDVDMPKYFATHYAWRERYSEGKIEYDLASNFFLIWPLEDAKPILEISHILTENDVSYWINWGYSNCNTLYPLGDNYIITKMQIKDLENPTQEHTFSNSLLTDENLEWLKTLEKPELTYTYSIDLNQKSNNSFVKSLESPSSYRNYSHSEIKQVILKGLGLNENASLAEIYSAIKSKTYSTTPIKDAHLTKEITKMNELEYFEAIASLDSLVCNLAATLTLNVSEDLSYVVGYYNADGDNKISLNEAHAWVMDAKGNIIENTPTSSKDLLLRMIQQILSWGFQNHIPLYVLLFLISAKISQKYGNQIIFTIKFKKIKKLMNKNDIAFSYASLNQEVYGGTYLPIEKTLDEYFDSIYYDYSSFTREELKHLKKELQQNKNYSITTSKLIHEIPYITNHYEELKRTLKKEKNSL